MYYNIKIKSDDSEFSLESQNRIIIEREMDAYFAYFFPASEEFKSKIKKVEINKENLVSISEIEQEDSKAVEIEQSAEQDEIVYYESSDDFDSEEELIIDDNETALIDNDEPEAVSIDDEEFVEQDLEDVVNEFEKEIEQNEFDKIESLTETKETLEENQQAEENSIAQEAQSEEETQPAVESSIEENQPVEQTPIEETQPTEETQLSKEAPLQEMPQIETMQIHKEEPCEIKELVFKNEPVEDNALKFSDYVFTNEKPVCEQVTLKQEPKIPKLDFKLFLAGFIISDIFNQFVACAYYIKNVLKKDSFNMKTINSYLFKATGTIADMSVLNDLISNGYISFKETESGKHYFITSSGEEYFVKKYQE